MELEFFANQMNNHAGSIHSLTLGISEEQARWKPEPQAWSILEVINHLYDEECADFRVRLDIILHHPAQPWPPINPAGWVTERLYNQRDLAQSRGQFPERTPEIAGLAAGIGSARLAGLRHGALWEILRRGHLRRLGGA